MGIIIAMALLIIAGRSFFKKRIREQERMRELNRQAALESWRKIGGTK
jgi:hypothetical protein